MWSAVRFILEHERFACQDLRKEWQCGCRWWWGGAHRTSVCAVRFWEDKRRMLVCVFICLQSLNAVCKAAIEKYKWSNCAYLLYSSTLTSFHIVYTCSSFHIFWELLTLFKFPGNTSLFCFVFPQIFGMWISSMNKHNKIQNQCKYFNVLFENKYNNNSRKKQSMIYIIVKNNDWIIFLINLKKCTVHKWNRFAKQMEMILKIKCIITTKNYCYTIN